MGRRRNQAGAIRLSHLPVCGAQRPTGEAILPLRMYLLGRPMCHVPLCVQPCARRRGKPALALPLGSSPCGCEGHEVRTLRLRERPLHTSALKTECEPSERVCLSASQLINHTRCCPTAGSAAEPQGAEEGVQKVVLAD